MQTSISSLKRTISNSQPASTPYPSLNFQGQEPQSPVSFKKKVTPSASKGERSESVKRKQVLKASVSTDDALQITPPKDVASRETATNDAKTLKKGQSVRDIEYIAPTANKNRHAVKISVSSQQLPQKISNKRLETPLYGKRKFQQLEAKENDGHEENVGKVERSLDLEEKKRNIKKVKPIESTTNGEAKSVEKIYLTDSSKTNMYCFPVYREKDLGYNRFIQDTTREVDIDNDCLTDTEVMENVYQWTIDDLKEGICRHLEERTKEEAESQEVKEELSNSSVEK